MKTIVSITTAAAILAGGSLASVHAQTKAHVLQTPVEVTWGPAPPFVPAGAQIAVMTGDPGKPAPYSLRFKLPANYAIPAHSHPMDENVVIVSGALTFGMGDKLMKGAGTKTLGVGGYALMPAGMNHFAYTATRETVVILYGTGPVDFKYVNPADDPRNKK